MRIIRLTIEGTTWNCQAYKLLGIFLPFVLR
jgi:hypothetical protein